MSDQRPSDRPGPTGPPSAPQYQQPQYQQPQYQQTQYDQPPQFRPQGQALFERSAPVGPDGRPPLWAPWYGIGFVQAYARYWRKYVRFDGRASRSEFWWVYLWNVAISVVLGAIWGIGFAQSGRETYVTPSGVETVVSEPSALFFIMGYVGSLWMLVIVLPSIALAWRRLHDANLAGPFFFLGLVPFFGGIALLVFTLLDSKPAGARFDRPEGSR
ncbi:DUF805 domain-containing protein [Curtobacterium sp. 1310]|uniref:DUF805 domain-containing protein n=1 Tax=Curtobacterium sp. 1310 TaxID=2806570 RepID=UPI001B7B000F|nr:DUF805 domain-containing protein [Curtobacterium sp. 1310]MBP1302367.1 uncharacterized membrane protein YhaH (DUF805 family) [Curtobacterium sp. 1310]